MYIFIHFFLRESLKYHILKEISDCKNIKKQQTPGMRTTYLVLPDPNLSLNKLKYLMIHIKDFQIKMKN